MKELTVVAASVLLICVALAAPRPGARGRQADASLEFSGRAPATGVLPVQAAVPLPMQEHYLGTLRVPELPAGAGEPHYLEIEQTWSFDLTIAAQNQTGETYYGWERNGCDDPWGAAFQVWLYGFRGDRPEDAFLWQGHGMPCVIGGAIVNDFPTLLPAPQAEWLEDVTVASVLASGLANGSSAHVGGTQAPWAEYNPHSVLYADWYGLEPGDLVHVAAFTRWDSGTQGGFEGPGYPTAKGHKAAYELEATLSLQATWRIAE